MGTVDKLTDLQRRRAEIEAGGGEEKIKKQHDAKKMTARERILALMDEGSFVEVDAFVSHRCTSFGMDQVEAPGEGVVRWKTCICVCSGLHSFGWIIGRDARKEDMQSNGYGT